MPAAGSWASTIGINMSAVRSQRRHRSPLIVVRRSPGPGTQQLQAASPRRTSVFLREASRVRTRWILEASNIRPPVGRGLRCSKQLILLLFLAPRPGLEPGTYGLTGGRSDRAAGRANAHSQESGLPILSSQSLRFPPGESAGSTTGYWRAFRLECLVARLCCFWISAWPQGAGHALESRRPSLLRSRQSSSGAGWRVAERASSKVASDYYRFQRLTGVVARRSTDTSCTSTRLSGRRRPSSGKGAAA